MGEVSIKEEKVVAEERTVQTPYVVQKSVSEDTDYTKKMKENFGFFGPASFLYAAFYAFCMFQNGSGITFPFFVAGSLLFLYLCLSKLEISLRKNSAFYMVSMMLLGISTFCTDDGKLIAFNKTGIFLLTMSLLLHQFYDTAKWNLGKYICSIFELVFCSMGEMGRPFSDGKAYYKNRGSKNKTTLYAVLGVVMAIPLLVIVIALLSSADAVFRQMTDTFFEKLNFGNIFHVLFRVMFIFFASYLLLAYLCRKVIKEEVKDRRTGEPVLAITITGLLSAIYLLFSGIQIIYLFLGQMQLPEGYTYAMYAREGFFQLLIVSIMNLVIVLVGMNYFKESKILKVILTIMSFCTFIMIVSSAMRMIIYIRYYYLTFLRVFVLWALVVLFLLFAGVIISIYKSNFPLFQYSMVVVTVLYIMLSFSHPDYIIAKVNVANAPRDNMTSWDATEDSFFLSEEPYHDYRYLSYLSADAAPVLLPYMAELGYDLNVYYAENIWNTKEVENHSTGRYRADGFGYYYLESLQESCENFSVRTYNISRHMALTYLLRKK
uniref:DUF4153 domain-containing protein n=1 Tax=Acetatifactor sp. TaxID=1872090 RepID=UPI0040577186